MKKRGLGSALLALTTVALGLAFVGSPAGAAERAEDCKTGVATIVDRPDSGLDGNWALDTFKRTYKVCRVEEAPITAKTVEVTSWTYKVEGSDEGTFKTQGSKTPKGLPANPATFPGRVGEFVGEWSLKMKAPSEWQYWAGGKDTNTLATGDWIKALWSQGATPVEEFTDWSWTYTLCGKAKGPTPPGTRWVNANGNNSGDITGKYECAKPEVKLTGPTCEDKTATLTVKNLNKFTKIFVQFGGGKKPAWVKPGEVATYTFTEGTVQVKVNGKALGEPYKYTPAKCETTPPPTTAPPTVPPPTAGGPSLPVTGAGTAVMAMVGGALLLGGAALFFGLRRRRQEKVTFSA